MLSTALDSLKAQELEGYQAVILCHSDEPQQHVHVIVNRVHPETGQGRDPLQLNPETLEMGRSLREAARQNLLRQARREQPQAGAARGGHGAAQVPRRLRVRQGGGQ